MFTANLWRRKYELYFCFPSKCFLLNFSCLPSSLSALLWGEEVETEDIIAFFTGLLAVCDRDDIVFKRIRTVVEC